MQKLTRRAALGVTASGLVAAMATTSPAQPPTQLPSLILAHKRAYARFEAAMDAEQALDAKQNRVEIFIPLSIGGTQSLNVGDDLEGAASQLRQDIAGRYTGELHRALRALERLSPSLAANARTELRKGQAADLRTMRRLIAEEKQRREASGFNAVWREYYSASDGEREALNAVISYRPATFAEMADKAEYLSHAVDGSCGVDPKQFTLLLEAMKGGAS